MKKKKKEIMKNENDRNKMNSKNKKLSKEEIQQRIKKYLKKRASEPDHIIHVYPTYEQWLEDKKNNLSREEIIRRYEEEIKEDL